MTPLENAEKRIQKALETHAKGIFLGFLGLTELPSSLKDLAPQLETLILIGNKLTECPSLEGFKHLKKLDLSHNHLTSLPESIGELESLEDLVLGEQKELESPFQLPSSLVKLTQLKYLNLQALELAEVPSVIWDIPSLTVLELDHNPLGKLPEELGNLNKLYLLSCYNSELVSLPDSLGNLQELTGLQLFQNKLTDLPDSIGHLQKLQFLFLDRNKLTTLPTTITGLTSLEFLLLSDNSFTELPQRLTELKSLKRFSCHDNPLQSSSPIKMDVGGVVCH